MKVSELIEALNKFPSDMEVYVCDEIEGNDTNLMQL